MALVVGELLARLRLQDELTPGLRKADGALKQTGQEARRTGESVQSLSQKQTAAAHRSAAAIQRQILAEQRLKAAKESGTATTQELMRLEAAANSAKASAISANSRLTSSQRQLAAAQDQSSRASQRQVSTMQTMVATARKAQAALAAVGVGIGVAGTVRFFQTAIANARALGAQTNQLNVLFGESQSKIQEWASTAVESMSMSNREAQAAAIQFATFGKAANLSGDDLANFSMKTSQLAADMASFFATSPEDAIRDLGSAFAGETEPMRKYGVMLDQATLKQVAAERGIAATGAQLSQQQKVAATYYAVMDQLGHVHGDVARTSEGFGQKIKRLQGRFEEVTAEIGQKLMPIASAFIDLLAGPGLGALSAAGDALGLVASLASTAAGAFNSLPGPLKAAIGGLVAFRIAQRLLGGQMGAIGDRITRLRTGLGNFGTTYTTALDYVRRGNPTISTAGAHFQALRGGITGSTTAMGAFQAAGRGLLGALGGPWGIAITGATVALGAWISKKQKDAEATQKAEQRIKSWSDAIRESNGIITDSIKESIAETDQFRYAAQEVEKYSDAYAEAGISSRELLDAVAEGGPRLDAVRDKLIEMKEAGEDYSFSAGIMLSGLIDLNREFGSSRDLAEQTSDAVGSSEVAFDSGAKATGVMAEALAEFEESADGAASKIDSLVKELNKLRDDHWTVEEAIIAWEEALSDFGETFAEVGGKAFDAAGNLDLTTEAGRDLFESMQDVAYAMDQTAVTAFNNAREAGLDVGDALDQARAAAQQNRDAFIEQGVAAGQSRERMEELADQAGLIPEEIIFRLSEDGLDDAITKLDRLNISAKALSETDTRLYYVDNTPEVRARLDELNVKYSIIDGKVVITDNSSKVMDAMSALGHTVRALPGGWIEIDDSSDETVQRLKDLGIEVHRVPGSKRIIVQADTEQFYRDVATALTTEQKRIVLKHVDETGHGVPYRPEVIEEAKRWRESGGRWQGGRIPRFASGGRLPTEGPGTERRDGIYGVDEFGRPVAMLDGGEWVINAEDSERFHDVLADINAGGRGLVALAQGDYDGNLARFGVNEDDPAVMAALRAQQALADGGVVGGGDESGAGSGDLGDNLATVADTVETVKTDQLDPAMEGVTQGVAAYGLTTEQQTQATVKHWQDSATAIQGTVDSTLTPMLLGIATTAQTAGTQIAGTVSGQINPAVTSVGSTLLDTQTGVVDPALSAMRSTMDATATTIRSDAEGVINPAVTSVGQTVHDVHAGTVDPVLGAMRGAVDQTAQQFGTGAQMIATQWNAVREATAAPVRFTIQSVFNNGLVGMWNSVAEMIGASKMTPYSVSFATGGVLPGYTPGRDIHKFYSPTAGGLELSGGEAIMRPEFTKAVGGAKGVEELNRLAMSGKPPVIGGDGPRKFAGGGIIQLGNISGEGITTQIQRAMWDAVRTAFPNVVLNSATRTVQVLGRPDNHNLGRALDLGGPMNAIARWIAGRYPKSLELIHAPEVGFKNIWRGQPHTYDAGTMGDHYDHVHWAMDHIVTNDGRLISQAGGGPMMIDPAEIVKSMLSEKADEIRATAGSRSFPGKVGEIPVRVADNMIGLIEKKAIEEVKKLAEFTGTLGPGGSVEQWRPMVIAALKRQGFEPSKRNQDLMLAQIQSESGGNPRAINLWDSNAQAGIPSKGLLQTIDPTFNTYRDPAIPGDVYDPWANMNAALRYYRATYGNDLGTNWGRGMGYNSGGTVRGAGDSDTVPAMLTPGEEVIRKDQAEKYRPLLKAINDDDGTGQDATDPGIRVFVTNWPAGTSGGTAAADPAAGASTYAVPDGADTVVPLDDASPGDVATQQQMAEATERLAEAEQELADLREDPEATDEQKAEAEARIEEARTALTEATEANNRAEQELATTREETPAPADTATEGEDVEDAFVLKLKNPLEPFWFRGEREHRERIIREYEEEQRRKGQTSPQSVSPAAVTPSAQDEALTEAEEALAEAQAALEEAKEAGDDEQIAAATEAVEKAEAEVERLKEALKTAGVVKMWTGGTVPGTGNTDSVPGMLTPGEEVIRKAMAEKHRPLLKAINADRLRYYNTGGTAGGFGGFVEDDRDWMKPTSLYDAVALGVGGISSLAQMAAPYAQMALTGQVDLGNLTPNFDTSANDPTGGFASSIVGDYASQISQQLYELIRAVKEGKDIHITVESNDNTSAADMVAMSRGV